MVAGEGTHSLYLVSPAWPLSGYLRIFTPFVSWEGRTVVVEVGDHGLLGPQGEILGRPSLFIFWCSCVSGLPMPSLGGLCPLPGDSPVVTLTFSMDDSQRQRPAQRPLAVQGPHRPRKEGGGSLRREAPRSLLQMEIRPHFHLLKQSLVQVSESICQVLTVSPMSPPGGHEENYGQCQGL